MGTSEQVIERCPLCGSDRATTIHRLTADDAASHFVRRAVEPERYDRIRAEICAIWPGETATVNRCDECGFGFASPFRAGSPLFYEVLLQDPSFTSDRYEFGLTLDVLKGAPDRSAVKILEVGAGDGAFTKKLISAGFNPGNIVCTEYSHAGAAAIRAVGVKCLMTDVTDLSAEGVCGLTAICIFQVMEHMDRLDEVWGSLTKLIAPGGQLFVSVPNGRGIEFSETHNGELDMPPNHIGRWDRASFERIGARHDWRLIDHRIEPTRRRAIARSLAGSRFFRARQTPGTLTDRATRFSNRRIRRIASAPLFAAWVLRSIPAAIAADPAALGGSQWAHFEFLGQSSGQALQARTLPPPLPGRRES